MTGYVYLIEEEPVDGELSGPWTKIGYSKNPPEWRMNANLKRGNPRTIRVAATFVFPSSAEAHSAEQAAHKRFASYRHQKEWFRVDWVEVAEWLQAAGGCRA